MGKQVRVNVRSVANVKAKRTETRNGRKVIIVPSATLPDDVVMNGVKYPASEIESSYQSLNRTPAPLGHPMINGRFVSARDPEGINLGYVGAWNENVRRENGRVFLDKVIDVEVANRSEGGKALLDAIDKGNPVHTSTGLVCTLEATNGASDYKYVARNMQFDHDAILLNEEGAATPEQGVGLFVNASGETLEVINSVASDAADADVDWAGQQLVSAIQRKHNAGVWDRIKTAVLEAIGSPPEQVNNRKEEDMADNDQLANLSKQVTDLSGKIGGLGDTIAKAVGEAVTNAVKPLVEANAAMVANQKAKDDAEKTELVNTVVKANLLDEGTAKELTLNALRKLAEKAKPGRAAALNGAGFRADGSDDEFAGVDLNAGLTKTEGK